MTTSGILILTTLMPVYITPVRLLCLLSALCIVLSGSIGCRAQAGGSPLQGAVSAHSQDYPVLTGTLAPADKSLSAEVYQYDSTPLSNRIPLLMLHGGGGESRPFFRMDRMASWLNANETFARKYKIYLVRYNASTVLEESVPHVKQAIREFYARIGKPIVALGYSLGGNVIQRALLDADLDSMIELVLTMGTPFHGSPLFCCDWYEYSLHRNHNFPLARIMRTQGRRAYFKKHPHFLSDLRWDNADGHVPEVGNFRSLIPFGPRGSVTVEGAANEKLAAINNEGPLTKEKFITYGGYLLNPFRLPTPVKQSVLLLQTPVYLVSTKFPLIFGDEHAALRLLNRDISRVLVHPRGASGGHDTMPYMLNDGLAPVTSCLLVSPEGFRAFPALREADLPQLNLWLDVRLARVFRNIDHVSFADGRPPHTGSPLVKDAMHPKEHRRAILDWLLQDLLDYAEKGR